MRVIKILTGIIKFIHRFYTDKEINGANNILNDMKPLENKLFEPIGTIKNEKPSGAFDDIPKEILNNILTEDTKKFKSLVEKKCNQ